MSGGYPPPLTRTVAGTPLNPPHFERGYFTFSLVPSTDDSGPRRQTRASPQEKLGELQRFRCWLSGVPAWGSLHQYSSN